MAIYYLLLISVHRIKSMLESTLVRCSAHTFQGPMYPLMYEWNDLALKFDAHVHVHCALCICQGVPVLAPSSTVYFYANTGPFSISRILRGS